MQHSVGVGHGRPHDTSASLGKILNGGKGQKAKITKINVNYGRISTNERPLVNINNKKVIKHHKVLFITISIK